MQLKTPGIFVQNLTPPVPFVPAIETALPAFIGYTEMAEGIDGEDFTYQAVRVQDITEFNTFFGGGFNPTSYRIDVDTQADNEIRNVSPLPRFFLYESLQHFYENGGGDCFIISVGSYSQSIELGKSGTADAHGLLRGLDVLASVDEPSLILFPDAVSLKTVAGLPDEISFGELQRRALLQCANRKDRFLIADLMLMESSEQSIDSFRDRVGTSNLEFGAAYFPWLYREFDHVFRLRELTFYDIWKTEEDARIENLNTFSSNTASDVAEKHNRLVREVEVIEGHLDGIIEAAGHADVTHDTIHSLVSRIDCAVSEVRVAAQEDYAVRFAEMTALIRRIGLVFPRIDYSLTVELQAVLDRLRTERNLVNVLSRLHALELLPEVRGTYVPPQTETEIEDFYTDLSASRWSEEVSVPSISGDAILKAFRTLGIALAESLKRFYDEVSGIGLAKEKTLFAEHPFFRRVAEAVALERKKIPPSGAIAGVYGVNDVSLGVWNAPANVALDSTLGPTVVIDDHDQEPLNVHFTGKSINAIRAFRGRGTRVWGARTLAGNSLDWRYIPVRRYFNFVEEFVKKAAEPFVFEPNDANTWMRIRMMLDQFLTTQWRSGALAGGTPQEAYFVHIGLSETMLQQDILEGRMIVEIGLAALRPAEFIVIRYICRMEQN